MSKLSETHTTINAGFVGCDNVKVVQNLYYEKMAEVREAHRIREKLSREAHALAMVMNLLESPR